MYIISVCVTVNFLYCRDVIVVTLMKHEKFNFLKCVSAALLVLETVIALFCEMQSFIILKTVVCFHYLSLYGPHYPAYSLTGIVCHIGQSVSPVVFLFNHTFQF